MDLPVLLRCHSRSVGHAAAVSRLSLGAPVCCQCVTSSPLLPCPPSLFFPPPCPTCTPPTLSFCQTCLLFILYCSSSPPLPATFYLSAFFCCHFSLLPSPTLSSFPLPCSLSLQEIVVTQEEDTQATASAEVADLESRISELVATIKTIEQHKAR